jgi:ribosomal protein L40E
VSEQYCMECGAALPISAKFCRRCGVAVVLPPVPEENPADQADAPIAAPTDSVVEERFCPQCGGENPAGFSACSSCGQALQEFLWTARAAPAQVLPGPAPAARPQYSSLGPFAAGPTDHAPREKSRHGCLTTWLIFIIIVNAGFAILNLLKRDMLWEEVAAPTWVVIFSVAMAVLTVVCAIALFRWQMWGFILFLFLAIVTCVVDVAVARNILAGIMAFIPVLVLYGVLHIGRKINGWDQLE